MENNKETVQSQEVEETVEEEPMTYQEIIALWKPIYKYCLQFDASIGVDETLTQEEIEGFLYQKATLMNNLLKMLITESIEANGEYDKDYALELLVALEKELVEEETPMTTFDSNYMREVIVEVEEDLKETVKDTE